MSRFWTTGDFVVFLFPDTFRIQLPSPFSTESVQKILFFSPVSKHFTCSRDFVVVPVSRHFLYSKDLVVSPVSRHEGAKRGVRSLPVKTLHSLTIHLRPCIKNSHTLNCKYLDLKGAVFNCSSVLLKCKKAKEISNLLILS